jgi:hypothetical protein
MPEASDQVACRKPRNTDHAYRLTSGDSAGDRKNPTSMNNSSEGDMFFGNSASEWLEQSRNEPYIVWIFESIWEFGRPTTLSAVLINIPTNTEAL